jgi:hypothetical protein
MEKNWRVGYGGTQWLGFFLIKYEGGVFLDELFNKDESQPLYTLITTPSILI